MYLDCLKNKSCQQIVEQNICYFPAFISNANLESQMEFIILNLNSGLLSVPCQNIMVQRSQLLVPGPQLHASSSTPAPLPTSTSNAGRPHTCVYGLSGSVTSCYKQPLCIHSQVLRCAGLFLGGWSQGEQGPHHTDLEGGSDPCGRILRSRAPKLCSKQRDISSGWACTPWIPYLKARQEEGQSARPMEGCLWPRSQ